MLAAGAVPVVLEDLILPIVDRLATYGASEEPLNRPACAVRVSRSDLVTLERILDVAAGPNGAGLAHRRSACAELWQARTGGHWSRAPASAARTAFGQRVGQLCQQSPTRRMCALWRANPPGCRRRPKDLGEGARDGAHAIGVSADSRTSGGREASGGGAPLGRNYCFFPWGESSMAPPSPVTSSRGWRRPAYVPRDLLDPTPARVQPGDLTAGAGSLSSPDPADHHPWDRPLFRKIVVRPMERVASNLAHVAPRPLLIGLIAILGKEMATRQIEKDIIAAPDDLFWKPGAEGVIRQAQSNLDMRIKTILRKGYRQLLDDEIRMVTEDPIGSILYNNLISRATAIVGTQVSNVTMAIAANVEDHVIDQLALMSSLPELEGTITQKEAEEAALRIAIEQSRVSRRRKAPGRSRLRRTWLSLRSRLSSADRSEARAEREALAAATERIRALEAGISFVPTPMDAGRMLPAAGQTASKRQRFWERLGLGRDRLQGRSGTQLRFPRIDSGKLAARATADRERLAAGQDRLRARLREVLARVDNLVRELDRDGNEELTLDELLAMVYDDGNGDEALRSGRQPASVGWAEDLDGARLEWIRSIVVIKSTARARSMFDRMQAIAFAPVVVGLNNTGVAARDLVQKFSSFVKDADLNDDGNITLDEVSAESWAAPTPAALPAGPQPLLLQPAQVLAFLVGPDQHLPVALVRASSEVVVIRGRRVDDHRWWTFVPDALKAQFLLAVNATGFVRATASGICTIADALCLTRVESTSHNVGDDDGGGTPDGDVAHDGGGHASAAADEEWHSTKPSPLHGDDGDEKDSVGPVAPRAGPTEHHDVGGHSWRWRGRTRSDHGHDHGHGDRSSRDEGTVALARRPDGSGAQGDPGDDE